MTTNPIVVGYDGSAGAAAAVDWAMPEADRTHTPVVLGYAFEWPIVPATISAGSTNWPDAVARQEAETMVQTAAKAAAEAHPGVAVTGTLLDGPAAVTLWEQSRHAALVVLGNRGHGGFADLLAGSTSVAVTTHAHCPVVVVRGEDRPADAPVLVGVDGSAGSLLALRYAFEQASDRRVPLRVIRTWTAPAARWSTPDFDPEDITASERAMLEALLFGWREKYPDVAVTTDVVADNASRALIEASRDARLVVVGSRGRGGFRGLLLGSVSQQLLYHSHCPVAVIRELSAIPPAPAVTA
jgi:nucleotide-binding universal stress UspA family protein